MIHFDSKIQFENEKENSYATFASMEFLLDKLKLLNYESEFLKEVKMRPIHKYYFVTVKNSGEQFYLFSLLASWLVRKTGKTFSTPEEYDDPNDTIRRILEEVKENGMQIDFPISKIKQGVGEHVVLILDFLANCALKKNNLTLQKLKFPGETEGTIETVGDESELNLDKVEEEMIAAYSDDSDEENIFHLGELTFNENTKNQHNFENSVVPNETWKLEVEEVLPLLKVTVKNENRDWRSHLEQMKNYKLNIDTSFSGTKGHLLKIHKEIVVTLEKVNNRERYLNRELENILDNYRTLQDQLSKIKSKYNSMSTQLTDKNKELYKCNDKVEAIKQQMEERGSSMTDGTPLVNIKKSVLKIKGEITEMDTRIGVLEYLLLQSKIQEEKLMENDFKQSILLF